jgi:uncharacterized membrane protein YeaQ/YmgE (transglycosylase-associated protein family)
MGILSWILLGGVAGWFASLLMGERQGFATNVIIGVIGAVLAGFFFSRFGGASVTGLNLSSFFVALVGSLLLVALCRALRGPQVS